MGLMIALAYLIDHCLGEPKRYHSLVGFGHMAHYIESKLYTIKQNKALVMGGIAWCLTVMPPVCILLLVLECVSNEHNSFMHHLISIIVLYFTIGLKSLRQHGLAVYEPLSVGDLIKGRKATAMIVSRDTSHSNETQLSTATVETITENTNDAVIAPIFYFCLFGPLGALLFRLANTLDAMWGYRNEKYEYFGKFAARVDDVLGFVPARITALLFIVVRPIRFRKIISSVWQQGRNWYSPNAGMVMAAGAAAINTKLGGNAIYHGQEKQRLTLGDGQVADSSKIKSSISLMYHASLALLLIVLLVEWLVSTTHFADLL